MAGYFKRYTKRDKFLDLTDHNRRADVLDAIISSLPANSIFEGGRILTRQRPFTAGGGTQFFHAIITGSAAFGERRKYAWSEAEATGDTWQVKSGGRSGTTTTDYALNKNETFHTSAFKYGVDKTGDAYPAGFDDRPVGGAGEDDTHKYNFPVYMEAVTNIEGDTKYWFSGPGSHDGACS